jgi:hypothetical protein
MDWAEGDYTLLLSADDMLTPGALARAAHVLDRHPEAGLVSGLAKMTVDGMPVEPVDDVLQAEARLMPGEALVETICRIGNPVASPVVVVRTATQKRVGPYSPDMLHTSDMEMWLRFAAVGPVCAVNACQAYYRWHGTNMSSNYYNRLTGDWNEQIRTCAKILEKHGDRLPQMPVWIQSMKQRIARDMLNLSVESYLHDGGQDWKKVMAFAETCDPAITQTPEYWRFLGKRLLGRNAVNAVRRIMGKEAFQGTAGRHSAWVRHGDVKGWWPDESLARPDRPALSTAVAA